MPELRWTLLILGALFIGALALWELRRQRHARGQGNPQGLAQGGSDGGEPEGRVYREPALTLPEMHADARGGLRVGNVDDFTHEEMRGGERGGHRGNQRIEPRDHREPVSDPRVVELDEESLAGLKVDSQPVVDEFSTSSLSAGDDALAEIADGGRRHEEPRLNEFAQHRLEADESEWDDAEEDEFSQDESEQDESAQEPLGQVRPQRIEPHIPELAPAHAVSALVESALLPTEPIVEWPDEDSRRIIALRLVSGAGERFAGRAVRLALAAEGFLPGKFDIFHKPGPDARAVLSAASLTKPGTLSLSTMDAQRFGGLSLFAVMPGPLSPLATFDELLATARALNDRLRGALQDERGEPLTPVRSASIRESLATSASANAPVVGPPDTAAPAVPAAAGAPGDAGAV